MVGSEDFRSGVDRGGGLGRRAKPGKHRVSNARGLYLNVGRNGGAPWLFRYNAGKNVKGNPIHRKMGLSARTDVTIDDAARRRDRLGSARLGPRCAGGATADRAAAKAQQESNAKRITFRQTADAWVAVDLPRLGQRRSRRQARARRARPRPFAMRDRGRIPLRGSDLLRAQ
jgi:hypothetical protein